jgi:hypothetical protein
VQLVNNYPAATYYLTQAGHHRTGIEAAVGYVDAGFARSRPEQTDDIVSSEFSSIERDWVIETIYQGAYLRQYHLWEKDCKEYFSSQGAPIPKTRRLGFTERVEQVLSSRFHIVVPQDRSRKPSTPSAQKRSTHLPTVLVPSRIVLEFVDAISGISRVPSQAARSIG